MSRRVDEEQLLLDADRKWSARAEAMREQGVLGEPKSQGLDLALLDGRSDEGSGAEGNASRPIVAKKPIRPGSSPAGLRVTSRARRSSAFSRLRKAGESAFGRVRSPWTARPAATPTRIPRSSQKAPAGLTGG
jgi:hypothetical protein